MKLFLITAAVFSVAIAAPDSYGSPRRPTQALRNGQNFGTRDRGTTENSGRNRFSDTFDLQQRNPFRSSESSNEDFSRESEFSSFDNEQNLNQVGFHRQGDSVFRNQNLRSSVFARNQEQIGVGFQGDQTGFNTDENLSEVDDFLAEKGPRNQLVRSQHKEVAGRFASGARDHAVPVFDRGQFGNPSSGARFSDVDQANTLPISKHRNFSQTFRGDRRGLNSVAPGQQTGEYRNQEQSRAQFESGVNQNRLSFEQRGSRDFSTSQFQTNPREENHHNFRGSIQNRPENTDRRFGSQRINQIHGPANLAQNFRSATNPCGQDEVIDFNGECVRQKVTRNIFVYQKPETKEDITNEVREQSLNYNILFIKTSNEGSVEDQTNEEKKTIVYVLNKEPTEEERKELEKDKHEVYFVNYKDGENPLLPHGSHLQTELNLSENGGLSSRFQQIAGNSNQTPFNSFNQNSEAANRRPFPLHDASGERLTVERPGFGNSNQALFFQNDRSQNSDFQRQDLAQDQSSNFSSSAFTNQQERAPVFGNDFHGQNLSHTEFEQPGDFNISQGNNDFEEISNGYEAPRA